MQDVVDSIRQLTLFIAADAIQPEFIDEFSDAAKKSKGNTQVAVVLFDSNSDVSVNMHSTKMRVEFNDTIQKILERYHIQYRLN